MATKKVRAGVIGCGAIAQTLHLPGYAKSHGITLAAACDPAMERRGEVERAFPGIRTYANYEAMLKSEDLGMVSVTSPNCFHAVHTCAALKAGANVLLEKPPALTLREIGRIRQTARQTGRKVMVGFTQRFVRGNQRAKKALAQGAVGKPYMIRMRFAHCGPLPGWAKSDWFYDPGLAGGGALFDMGIHAIDLALWLMGPVCNVQATSKTLRKQIRVEDNAVLLLEFAGGRALGYIEVGWTSPSGFYGWEICGDRGSLLFDYQGKLVLRQEQRDPSGKVRGMRPKVLDARPTIGGWDCEVQDIVKALSEGEDLGIGIEAGGRAVAVALAGYESARTGKRVEVRL